MFIQNILKKLKIIIGVAIVLFVCLFFHSQIFAADHYSTAISGSSFNRPLTLGSHGPDVSILQQTLKDLGFYTYPEITGYFGSITQTAVQAFQIAKGIVSSGTPHSQGYGRVGPATIKMLNTISSSSSNSSVNEPSPSSFTFSRTLSIGMTGGDVSQLQQFLKEKGFYLYPQITGYFGSITQTALLAFQRANHLQPSGQVDVQTQASISGGSGALQSTPLTQVTPTFISSGGGAYYPSASNVSTPAAPTPDTTSPTISSIASSPTPTTAIISFNTNEIATSSVYYGLTTSYGSSTTSSVLATSTTFNLTGLTSSTLYHFQVAATDASGNTSTSSDQTFTTTAIPAPIISSIASSTSQTTATITWTTDQAASSTINFGTSISYGSASSSQSLVTSHSIVLSGLSAGTTYHFQVGGANSAGTVSTSSDQTFTTQATSSQTVTTMGSTSTTQTTVTLQGNLTSIGSYPVTTEGFQYATNPGFSGSQTVFSSSAGFATGTYSLPVTGLTCNTTYYYAAYASNPNAYVTGNTLTFTTSPCSVTIPTLTTSPATSVGTSTAFLNGAITNDGGASSTVRGFNIGTSTSYTASTTHIGTWGVAAFGTTTINLLPSTTYHYRAYATNSAGTGYGSDQTFTTSAASDVTPPTVFLTAPLSGTILKGNVALTATSSDNVGVTGVQFKIDGVNTGVSGTSSPFSIVWNSTGVSDGSHTISAVANDAAGNYATSSLSFTIQNNPPVISSIGTSTTQTTVTINWNTNNTASSTVNYGTTTAYGSASSSQSLVTSHSIVLSGLTAGTTYHFQVGGSDVVGNISTSSDQTFTTQSLSVAPPTLTIQSATSIATSSATLNGTITSNNNASSTVEGFNYGTTTAYGLVASSTGTFNIGAFSKSITALSPSTTYHYQAFATNATGTGTSSDQTFTTQALPAPIISSVASSTTQTTATISWTTDQAASSTVNFGTTTAYGIASSSQSLVTSHSIVLSGLTAATTYHFQVGGANSAGTVSTSSDFTFTTASLPVTAPTVTAQAASAVTFNGATLNGTITSNNNGSSTIEGFNYGTTTSYGSVASSTGSFAAGAFSQTISGLAASTTYHYQAFATNASGTGTSSDVTFTTPPTPDTTPPTISSIASSPTPTTAIISFNTNEIATSSVYYGLTTSYGSSTTSSVLATSTTFNLTGLTSSTLYHFQVAATDASGNTSTSSDQTFTTTATTTFSAASSLFSTTGRLAVWADAVNGGASITGQVGSNRNSTEWGPLVGSPIYIMGREMSTGNWLGYEITTAGTTPDQFISQTSQSIYKPAKFIRWDAGTTIADNGSGGAAVIPLDASATSTNTIRFRLSTLDTSVTDMSLAVVYQNANINKLAVVTISGAAQGSVVPNLLQTATQAVADGWLASSTLVSNGGTISDGSYVLATDVAGRSRIGNTGFQSVPLAANLTPDNYTVTVTVTTVGTYGESSATSRAYIGGLFYHSASTTESTPGVYMARMGYVSGENDGSTNETFYMNGNPATGGSVVAIGKSHGNETQTEEPRLLLDGVAYKLSGKSVTRSRTSNVATIKTALPHGLTTGDVVTMSGFASTTYSQNETSVTVIDSTTFTYPNSGPNEATTTDTGGRFIRKGIKLASVSMQLAQNSQFFHPNYASGTLPIGTNTTTYTLSGTTFSTEASGTISVAFQHSSSDGLLSTYWSGNPATIGPVYPGPVVAKAYAPNQATTTLNNNDNSAVLSGQSLTFLISRPASDLASAIDVTSTTGNSAFAGNWATFLQDRSGGGVEKFYLKLPNAGSTTTPAGWTFDYSSNRVDGLAPGAKNSSLFN